MASAGARRETEGGTLGGPCTVVGSLACSMVHKWAEAASFFLPLSRHQPHECCTGGKFGQELRLCVLMIVSSFCAHRRRLKPQVALKLFQGTPNVEAERGSGHTHPPSAAVNLNSGRSLSMSDQLVFNKLWCSPPIFASVFLRFSCKLSHAGMNRTVILFLPLIKPHVHRPVLPPFLSLCAL